MAYASRFARRVLAPIAFVLLPAVALAQGFENPPVFNAAQLSGFKRVGENYTIKTPVRSDGILRVYVLATPYGDFTIHGDEMLRMRINELNALTLLEKASTSDSFGKAVAEAGLSPLVFTGHLIVDPAGTMQNTFAGVGNFFARIGSGLNNAGKARDDAVSSLLGVTDERRHLAATYGVDPYTDFPPLAAKLNQLAGAAATGGLVVKGALMVIPGAAGIVVSNLSTVSTLNNMTLAQIARDYSEEQIIDLNRGLLTKMGISAELTENLLANRNYSPIDLAAMVAALNSMRGVEGRNIFVARAAAADGRAIAYVMRRMAEYMADDHRRNGGYVRFVSLANFPYAVTRDGRVTAVLPIDALAWTQQSASGFSAVSADRRRLAPRAQGQMRLTGMATALAKKELKSQGWTVLEHQHP
jgi:hypothetical protein